MEEALPSNTFSSTPSNTMGPKRQPCGIPGNDSYVGMVEESFLEGVTVCWFGLGFPEDVQIFIVYVNVSGDSGCVLHPTNEGSH